MNVRRIAGRVAAVGAVGALGAGALVGLTSTGATAAAAAPVPYTCTALGRELPVLVQPTGSLPDLEPGDAVAAGADLPVDFIIPRAVLDGMKSLGITSVGISTTDFGLTLGTTPVGLTDVNAPQKAAPATGDLVLTAPAKTAAFTAPAAGTYDLSVPSTFSAVVSTNLIPLNATCAITDPSTAKIGSVTVDSGEATTQPSTTSATAPKKVTQGTKVKVSVVVTTDAPATGTVTAAEGAKKLGSATLSGGKATITVKGLKPGKHTIVVSYSGDDSTDASTSAPIKVTVKKKK